jgi:hypothetical protein
MDNMTLSLLVLLMTALLWVAGAILHWSNIRRQEKLVTRLRRMAVCRPGPSLPVATVAAPEPPKATGPLVEYLRPARRWTV